MRQSRHSFYHMLTIVRPPFHGADPPCCTESVPTVEMGKVRPWAETGLHRGVWGPLHSENLHNRSSNPFVFWSPVMVPSHVPAPGSRQNSS